MGEIVRFPRHARASAGSGSATTSGPVQSSADTSPPVNDLIASIAFQSGRTKRRRYRLTLTRDLPIATATSSSVSSRDAMKSERCIPPDVHPAHIAGQGVCTSGVVYLEDSPVHPVYMSTKTNAAKQERVVSRLKPDPRHGKTFIREWRAFRGLTLEQLAERIGVTHATLSRIERGRQPYNQPLLEALAEGLMTDTASLLIRDPKDPTGIWTIWDRANQGQRRQIVEIAETLLRTAAAS